MDSIWEENVQLPRFSALEGDLRTDVLIIGGGVIPETDIPALKEAGVAEVFTPGTPTGDVVNFIKEHVEL